MPTMAQWIILRSGIRPDTLPPNLSQQAHHGQKDHVSGGVPVPIRQYNLCLVCSW